LPPFAHPSTGVPRFPNRCPVRSPRRWRRPPGTTDSVADGLGNQSFFGPPYLSFGRFGSGSNLPGYMFATASFAHTFKNDFSNTDDELSQSDVSIWLPLVPLNYDRFHLIAGFGYRSTWTDSTIPELLPENDLNAFRFPIAFVHDISERWIWGGFVMPAYAGEASSWNTDGFSFSAVLGVAHAYSRYFNIAGGLYYYNGFGDQFVLPGVAFTWRPNANTEVYLMPPFGGVTYMAGDWMLGLYGHYDPATYNVSADEEAPNRDVRLFNFRVGAKVERQLYGFAYAYLAGGYSFGRNLEITRQGTDDHILDENIKAAPYILFGINGRF
jgi:hypothetical protein